MAPFVFVHEAFQGGWVWSKDDNLNRAVATRNLSRPRLTPASATPAVDGMVVETQSKRVVA